MKVRTIWVAAMILLVACVAAAHGNKKHVMGTVDKINPDSVVVKTANGPVEVKLAASTVFVKRDGSAAKPADLAVGDRVVIHATPNGDSLSADEVRFAPPGGSAAADSTAKPKN